MQTLGQLQRRIATAGDLSSIVRTMKVLAAVSIRQYEQAVHSLEHYHRTVEYGLQILVRHDPELLLRARPAPRLALGLVVFGSDQGMCGQLNDQVAARALELLNSPGVPRSQRLLVVGARAAVRLEDAGPPMEAVLPVPSSLDAVLPAVQQLLLAIQRWHTEQGVDHVLLCYSQYLSGAAYRPRIEELLPLDQRWLKELAARPWPTRMLPSFTLPVGSLLEALTREYLFVCLYRALAQSLASENASRLVSMQAAERNVEERLGELQALYNQERHMTITGELLDIVAGFEAMSESP